jgi:hypothetical protein
VERAVILDICPLADLDPFVVASKNCAKPNARADLYPHSPNNDRCIRDVTVIQWCHIWFLSTQTKQRHPLPHRKEI